MVLTSGHRVVTAQNFATVNVNAKHKKKYSTVAMTYSRNIRISDNAIVVKVIHKS